MFKRLKVDEIYNKKLSLLASKIVWMADNEEVNTLLLSTLEPVRLPQFCINTIEEIQNLTTRSVALYEIDYASENLPDIDWDHDLIIFYLNNCAENRHLSSIANKVDRAYLLLESSVTSRNDANRSLQIYKEFNITVSGTILHEYVEKVPNFIQRIFF